VQLGSVNGQNELALQPIDLAFAAPPAGTWQIVLMLREWTAGGFVTRDFASFATPFISAPVLEPAPSPVAETPQGPALAAVSCLCAEPAPTAVVEKPSVPVVEKAAAPAVASARAPVTAGARGGEVAKAAGPVPPPKAPADACAKLVSVNTARLEELAAVNGLSTKLAQGIVRKRPFASLDDLRRVKGLGANLLAKVRSSLKL
jgi:competence ComEA-like helix-hairpin-helix protein